MVTTVAEGRWVPQLLKSALSNLSLLHISIYMLLSKLRLSVFTKTRGPPIGAAPLNLKISADILCVISSDLASNRRRIIRLFVGFARFLYCRAVFSYILHPTGSSQWLHIRCGCRLGWYGNSCNFSDSMSNRSWDTRASLCDLWTMATNERQVTKAMAVGRNANSVLSTNWHSSHHWLALCKYAQCASMHSVCRKHKNGSFIE